MSDREKMIRQNVRNFLMLATLDELRRELEISVDLGDAFRASCVRELIAEHDPAELVGWDSVGTSTN